MVANFQILRVNLRDNSEYVSQRLFGLGLKEASRKMKQIAQKAVREYADELAEEVKSAVQEKTPRDTGELADYHVEQYEGGGIRSSFIEVYVDSDTHRGRRNSPKSASFLAWFLDQNAHRGWSEDAAEYAKSIVRKRLNRLSRSF